VIDADIDLKAEIAGVQAELIFFRQMCLPAFKGRPMPEVVDGMKMPTLAGRPINEVMDGLSLSRRFPELFPKKLLPFDGSLSMWQCAATRLADLLPLGPLPANTSKISRDDFRNFLYQSATSSFCLREGRIIWQISLNMNLWLCFYFCAVCSDLSADAPDALEKFLTCLPQVRRWLMGLPVESPELWNALCAVLPFVAEADPAFAKLALDPETWRNLVINDREITEEQRGNRLQFIDGYFGHHVLNEALLHTLGALAGNHFLLIEEYLDHPHICGCHARLMPHYLFAVLFEKVAILRQLAQERHDFWKLAPKSYRG
jgi:hypothetical protein